MHELDAFPIPPDLVVQRVTSTDPSGAPSVWGHFFSFAWNATFKKFGSLKTGYPKVNFLAPASKTSRLPVTSGISNRVRIPSILECGMLSTRRCFFSLVVQIDGKSFPLRSNSVHARARSPDVSFAHASDTKQMKQADPGIALDLNQ